MKKTLLTTLAMFSMVSVFAQVDITPARYVIQNQEAGTYKIDEAMTGANPPAGYAAAVENFDGGYIVLNNGQMANLEAPNAKSVVEGTQIVEIPGYGKVLLFKGANSTYKYGTASETAQTVGWWNASFYTGTEMKPEETVRFQIIFKVYENVADLSSGGLRFDAYTYENNHQSGGNEVWTTKQNVVWKSGDFVQRYEDDGSPVLDDDENPVYDDDIWQQLEYDWGSTTEAGVPLRMTMHLSGGKFNNYAILIKSIKVILNPEGEPETKTLTTAEVESSINGVKADSKGNGNIYNVAGQRVSNTNSHGIYIKDGKKILK